MGSSWPPSLTKEAEVVPASLPPPHSFTVVFGSPSLELKESLTITIRKVFVVSINAFNSERMLLSKWGH